MLGVKLFVSLTYHPQTDDQTKKHQSVFGDIFEIYDNAQSKKEKHL
jgi:hypothetical protein